MGLTAATGEPVMIIIIVSSSEIGIEETKGFDHRAFYLYNNEKTLEGKKREDKALSGLPSCIFGGKSVLYLLAQNPKGSMTSPILREVLKILDDLEIFNRYEGGPIPMRLFDGHDSLL